MAFCPLKYIRTAWLAIQQIISNWEETSGRDEHERNNISDSSRWEMNVCVRVHGKGVNSTLQFNPLVTKLPLTEGLGVGLCLGCYRMSWFLFKLRSHGCLESCFNGVTGLSCLWGGGEGGIGRREGVRRREPQGVRKLRERYIKDHCRPSCQLRLQSTTPSLHFMLGPLIWDYSPP